MGDQRKRYSDDDRYRRKNSYRKGKRHQNSLPNKGNRQVYRSRKRKAVIFDSIVLLLILSILFVFLLFVRSRFDKGVNPVSSSAGIEGTELKNLNSSNAILVRLKDDGSGETIARKNADERIYPASLTKIMTAILAIENIEDMGHMLEMPADIFPYLYEMDASVAGFEPGETATAKELVYGVVLESGAECCLTLADFIAGSEDAFVELMNRKAKELGMTDTHFCNTTGLHDKNHYTTVRELSVLLEYALKNQEFRQIFTSSYYIVEPTDHHPDGFTMQSTLFENLGSPEMGDGQILGGKTGYTQEAGLCLASLAAIDGEEYILVTAHAEGSHETEQYHIDDAIKVYGQL